MISNNGVGRCICWVFVLNVLLLSWQLCGNVTALPPGFRDEGVGFKSGATGFTFIPHEKAEDGFILLIGRKKGEVVAIMDVDNHGDQNNQNEVVNVLDIMEQTCDEGERGLSQLIPHPNFTTNRYVYVFYTYDKYGKCGFSVKDGPVNVVSRFTIDYNSKNGEPSMINEQIIFETSSLPSKVHNAGDMIFGNDGYLYVTLGNGGMAYEYGNSQKSNTLLGSIIRLTDDGGIPPTNPFVMSVKDSIPCNGNNDANNQKNCQEIYSMGLRNPFRFAMNPNTSPDITQLYINDVGGSTWEEINELTIPTTGAPNEVVNYGYREWEGPCDRGSKTNCPKLEAFTDPLFWYEHNADKHGGDSAITGGVFIPKTIDWPQKYTHQTTLSSDENTTPYLFADFIYKEIYLLEKVMERDDDYDQYSYCRECSPPRSGYKKVLFHSTKDTGQPLTMMFGPYQQNTQQALYYSLWSEEGEYNIRRIIYQGGGGGGGSNTNNNNNNNSDSDSDDTKKNEDTTQEENENENENGNDKDNAVANNGNSKSSDSKDTTSSDSDNKESSSNEEGDGGSTDINIKDILTANVNANDNANTNGNSNNNSNSKDTTSSDSDSGDKESRSSSEDEGGSTFKDIIGNVNSVNSEEDAEEDDKDKDIESGDSDSDNESATSSSDQQDATNEEKNNAQPPQAMSDGTTLGQAVDTNNNNNKSSVDDNENDDEVDKEEDEKEEEYIGDGDGGNSGNVSSEEDSSEEMDGDNKDNNNNNFVGVGVGVDNTIDVNVNVDIDSGSSNIDDNTNTLIKTDVDAEDYLKEEMMRNNMAPDAEIMITKTLYEVNELIVFDGTNSSDPDHHPHNDGNDTISSSISTTSTTRSSSTIQKLMYHWDLGDGTTSTDEIVEVRYSKPGKYRIRLTVQDRWGFEDKTSIDIMVGKLPVPIIFSPLNGATFHVGETFQLVGYGVTANGTTLDPTTDLTWEVRQMHNTHYHPFLDATVGNEIRLSPAPSPEDFQASTTSFLRVLLTATDPTTGLSQTIIRDLMPKTKTFYFQTNPPGLTLNLDGFNIQTPANGTEALEVVSWINHNISLLVEDQGDMIFDSWNNGMQSREGKLMVREEKDKENVNEDGGGNSTTPPPPTMKIRTARFHRRRGNSTTTTATAATTATTTTTTATRSSVLPAHRRTRTRTRSHLRSARIKSTTTTTSTP